MQISQQQSGFPVKCLLNKQYVTEDRPKRSKIGNHSAEGVRASLCLSVQKQEGHFDKQKGEHEALPSGAVKGRLPCTPRILPSQCGANPMLRNVAADGRAGMVIHGDGIMGDHPAIAVFQIAVLHNATLIERVIVRPGEPDPGAGPQAGCRVCSAPRPSAPPALRPAPRQTAHPWGNAQTGTFC